ncbi:transmembrane 4 L6 family member 18 [Ambystoma mexicanum]|uniref:transmembrane 4 L6 family member 18 n=1 Tax=Ambystoma mexicanum TaxID=8296 RepID=UPI0037E765AF
MCTAQKLGDWLSFLLIPSAVCCIAANILLYFPNGDSTYAADNRLTNYVWYFEGICFSGVMILIIATLLLTVDQYTCFACCCYPKKAWSQRFSRLGSPLLALLGVTFSGYCLIISSLGLSQGPYCNTVIGWTYPFKDTPGSYLTNSSTWTLCLKPAYIVEWNIVLFSVLIGLSAFQAIICFVKAISELHRMLCGTHSMVVQPESI